MKPGTTTTADPSPGGIPKPQNTGETFRQTISNPTRSSCQMGDETAMFVLRMPERADFIRSSLRKSLAANKHEVLPLRGKAFARSEEHTSELQSRPHLVCRLLLEKKKKKN